MPRIARVVVPGMAHHITHRGVRRSDVFWDDSDRWRYLQLLRIACDNFLLRIWAYCLMTNHVHLVAVPGHENSIADVFHWVHGIYDQHFNRKYGLSGNLWESRPYSAVLDEPHTYSAVRYVEMNPVRAGLVVRACDYKWSSAPLHCGLVAVDPLVDPTFPPPGTIQDWSVWLQGTDQVEVERIRRSTTSGRPCGDQSFIRNIEDLTQRSLSPRKRGRPFKNS